MAVEFLDDIEDIEAAAVHGDIEITPQSGPQILFARTSADIAIYGGGAGGGKTWALLIDPLRHIETVGFNAVFFRRTTPQITNPGGLLDASFKVYTKVGGGYLSQPHEWRWPVSKIKFSHLQHESTVHNWQGSEIPCICFDELTHFTAAQFWYLVSRNRSMCGVKPYIRATCNPDADSWVAEFISWWIDQATGLPIKERIGKIRWVVRVNDKLIWGDSAAELAQYLPTKEQLPEGVDPPIPKSVTFIPATLFDNQELMRVNPEYLANLLSLPLVERERLLGGNWKIRPSAGLYFKRGWVEVVDTAPVDLEIVRYYDLAGTEKRQDNDPDWTVGVKLGRDRATGILYVLHVVRERMDPFGVEQLMLNTASQDGKDVRIGWGLDPGQAGKAQSQYLARRMSGFTVLPERESGDKVTRFGPTSSQCRAGNVKIVRGPWNEEFFRSLEGFPDLAHDDDVDAFSGAFEMLNSQGKGWGIFELYRRQAEQLAKDEQAKRDAAAAEQQPEIPYAIGSIEYNRAVEARKAAEAVTVSVEPAGVPIDPGNRVNPASGGTSAPAIVPPSEPKVGSLEWMKAINSPRH